MDNKFNQITKEIYAGTSELNPSIDLPRYEYCSVLTDAIINSLNNQDFESRFYLLSQRVNLVFLLAEVTQNADLLEVTNIISIELFQKLAEKKDLIEIARNELSGLALEWFNRTPSSELQD